jgi:hypothetical protein
MPSTTPFVVTFTRRELRNARIITGMKRVRKVWMRRLEQAKAHSGFVLPCPTDTPIVFRRVRAAGTGVTN